MRRCRHRRQVVRLCIRRGGERCDYDRVRDRQIKARRPADDLVDAVCRLEVGVIDITENVGGDCRRAVVVGVRQRVGRLEVDDLRGRVGVRRDALDALDCDCRRRICRGRLNCDDLASDARVVVPRVERQKRCKYNAVHLRGLSF